MSFEDGEIAMLELKKMLFQSLYTWIVAFNRLSFSNLSEFLEFSFFCILGVLSFILQVYYGCAPCAFNEFELLI
jgi:hypothetical protein